jgi:predicted LPLAT superfamily acyltransferase
VAAAADCPVAVLFSAKIGPRSYLLDLAAVIRVPEGTGQPPSAFAPALAQFVRALEDYTRDHPWQFFNFYDLWEAAMDPTAAGRKPLT